MFNKASVAALVVIVSSSNDKSRDAPMALGCGGCSLLPPVPISPAVDEMERKQINTIVPQSSRKFFMKFLLN